MEIDKKISFDRVIPLILFYQPCSKKLALDLYLRGIHNKTQFFSVYHISSRYSNFHCFYSPVFIQAHWTNGIFFRQSLVWEIEFIDVIGWLKSISTSVYGWKPLLPTTCKLTSLRARREFVELNIDRLGYPLSGIFFNTSIHEHKRKLVKISLQARAKRIAQTVFVKIKILPFLNVVSTDQKSLDSLWIQTHVLLFN